MKAACNQLTDAARDRKARQDDVLRRHAQNRAQIQQLRKQLAEAQQVKLEEACSFQDRISDRTQRINAATEESL